jgi:hypothetical protein
MSDTPEHNWHDLVCCSEINKKLNSRYLFRYINLGEEGGFIDDVPSRIVQGGMRPIKIKLQ